MGAQIVLRASAHQNVFPTLALLLLWCVAMLFSEQQRVEGRMGWRRNLIVNLAAKRGGSRRNGKSGSGYRVRRDGLHASKITLIAHAVLWNGNTMTLHNTRHTTRIANAGLFITNTGYFNKNKGWY